MFTSEQVLNEFYSTFLARENYFCNTITGESLLERDKCDENPTLKILATFLCNNLVKYLLEIPSEC